MSIIEIFRLFGVVSINSKAAIAELGLVNKAGASSGAKLGKVFTDLGKLLKKVAIAGAAAATFAVVKMSKDSIEAFGNFEDKMNEVFTLLPGITEEAMDSMKEDVQLLSKEMGILPDEVIPALYQAISAGIPQENVFDFMEVASRAAIGGVTTLETSVDGLTSVVNAYGDNVITVGEAADAIFTAVRLGKTTFDEMSDSLFYVNPVAASLGVNFDEVAAAMAEITSQGVPTRNAATYLGQAFNELSKEGTVVYDTFKEITGASFKDFIKGGGSVQDALKLLEDYAADTGTEVKDLWGSVEAGKAILALTGSHVESFSDKMDEFADKAGAADSAYEGMAKGLKKQWDKIKAWWATVKINVGEKFQEPIQELITFLEENQDKIETFVGDIFDKLIEAFRWVMDHGDVVALGIKGIAAALVVLVAVKLTQWANLAVTAFTTLAGVVGISSPLALGIMAIALLLGGLALQLKDSEADTESLAEGSSTAFEKVVTAAEYAKDHVETSLSGIQQAQLDSMNMVHEWANTFQEDLSKLTEEELAARQKMEEESAAELFRIKEASSEKLLADEARFEESWIESSESAGEEVIEEKKGFWGEIISLAKTGWEEIAKKADSSAQTFYNAMAEMGDSVKSMLSDTLGEALKTWASYGKDREKAAQEHEDRLLEIEEEYAENVAELDEGYKADLIEADEDYHSDLTEAEEDYQKESIKITEDYQKDLAKANEDYQKDLVEADKDYAKDRVKIEEDYADEIEGIEEDSHDRREDAMEDFQERMRDLETDHEWDLADLLTNYNNYLEEEDLRHQRRQEDLKVDYLRDIAKLEADDFEGRARIEARYKEDLEDEDTKHLRKRTDLETTYNDDIEKEDIRHQRDQETAEQTYVDNIEKIETDSRDDKETARNTYHDDVTKAEEDHQSALEKAQTTHEEDIEKIEEDSQKDREDALGTYNESVEKADSEHATDREKIEGDYNKEMEDLLDDRDTLRDEEVKDYEDQQKSMWEVLGAMAGDLLTALKNELLVKAAFHVVEAIANSLIPPLFVLNPMALGHDAAAAAYLAGAGGLALAGFEEGAVFEEPTLMPAHMVAEAGYQEAYLLLSPSVFDKIGAGIMNALTPQQPALAAAGESSIQVDMRGLYDGATINVRSDQDIEQIARETYTLYKDRLRSIGRHV